MSPAATPFRSMLFMPATRVELLAKTPRWGPDCVVVDLEDAVAPDEKDSARRSGVEEADLRRTDTTVLVRINPPGSRWFDDDVAAVARSGAAGAVVPKAEDPAVLEQVASRLRAGRDPAVVVAGIETAAGVWDARRILASASTGYFGAEDYIADLGGRRTPGGLEVLHARSTVALAGRLAEVPVLDQAVVRLDDDEAFSADARAGRDLGFAGKICIHPRQVVLANDVFTPTPDEVAAAHRILAAGEAGVGVVDGQMVDAVHLRLAERVIERAARAGTSAGRPTP